MNIRDLARIGGREWKSGDKHRVYFEPLTFYGWSIDPETRHDLLDGERISGGEMRKLRSQFVNAKIFYDVAAGKFKGENIDSDNFKYIVGRIRKKVGG